MSTKTERKGRKATKAEQPRKFTTEQKEAFLEIYRRTGSIRGAQTTYAVEHPEWRVPSDGTCSKWWKEATGEAPAEDPGELPIPPADGDEDVEESHDKLLATLQAEAAKVRDRLKGEAGGTAYVALSNHIAQLSERRVKMRPPPPPDYNQHPDYVAAAERAESLLHTVLARVIAEGK